MAKGSKNHQPNPRLNQADRATGEAFLHLGDILADVAHDLAEKDTEKGAEAEQKVKPRG